MLENETNFPLAYFITFTCYGTWLHGNEKTSVDMLNNIVQTKFLNFNPVREECVKKRMVESSYLLDATQRSIVMNAIKEVCKFRAWVLLAAHIRTNHVHFIVHAIASPEFVMTSVKAYASRRLKELEGECARIKRWTRHGSTRYLWKDEEVEASIHYVVHEQGKAMAVFENLDRACFAGAVIAP